MGSHSPRCLWAWCSEAKPPAGCRAPHGQVSPIEAGLWWKFSSWRLSPGACRPWAHRSWCQIKAWNSVKFSCPHKLVKKKKKSWYHISWRMNLPQEGELQCFQILPGFNSSIPRFRCVKRISCISSLNTSGHNGTHPARSNPRRSAHCFSAWHHPRRWCGVAFNFNMAIDINTTRLSASEKAQTSQALFKCSGVKSVRSATSTASCE